MKNPIPLSLLILFLSFYSFAAIGTVHSSKSSMLFLENKGQITDQYYKPRQDIQFKVATDKGFNIFIGDGQIHYQFLKQNQLSNTTKEQNIVSEIEGYRMDVILLNAAKNAKIEIKEEQAYVENYFTHALNGVRVRSFKKIIYKEVYPHIDWIFYFKNNQLKHEFVVRKGGNIADIKLQYKGSTDLRIGPNGGLVAQTEMGEIVESPPICFQADGQIVVSNYVLKEDVLSYKVAPYVGELTIDPSLEWATYYGGSSFDFLGSIVSNGNNVYSAGGSSSASNIATIGAHKSVNIIGSQDAILVKMSTSGARVWATYYGGSNGDLGIGIAIDNNGSIYMSGYTKSNSGIATTGAHQSVYAGGGLDDAFLAKFSNEGVLIWATYYGGSENEGEAFVTTDPFGNVFLSGYTNSTTGIATTGAHQTTIGGLGYYDAFLVKFNSLGVRQWGTYFGGEWDERGYRCITDKVGNVYITGTTASTANIASSSAHKSTFSGGSTNDAYLAKFDNSGSRIWSTYYGGTGADIGYSVATDDSLNIYFVGSTWSNSDIATAGAYQIIYAGGPYDAFIAKLDKNGVRQWGTYYGWLGEENAYDVQVRGMKDVFVSGMTTSNFLIATDSAYQKTFAGEQDAMLLQFNDSGKRVYATYFGGDKFEDGRQISVSGASLYMCGTTASTSGVATSGAHQTIYGGSSEDGYLAKFIFPLPEEPASVYKFQANSLRVYPNPANTLLNISVANNASISVTMVDMLGRTIANEQSQNGNISINTQNLVAGMYLLSIRNAEGNQQNTKVMVKH